MFRRKREQRAAAAAAAHLRFLDAHLRFFEQCLATAQGRHEVTQGDGTWVSFPLRPGEQPLFSMTGAALVEARRGPGHWEGRSSGVSVRIPGTRSMRYRIGATHGTFVHGEERPTPIDTGSLTLTTQRAVFVGAAQTREWRWSNVVGIEHHADQPWTSIAVSNRQRTAGVAYDRKDADTVRFWIEMAMARATGGTDRLVTELRAAVDAARAELAAVGPAPDRSAAPVARPAPTVPADGAPAPTAPPAWYADPTGRNELRYWNGTAWTDDVAKGCTSVDRVGG